MHVLIFLLLFSPSVFSATVTDKEAEEVMTTYKQMFEKQDAQLVDKVLAKNFFADKNEREIFLKNLKSEKLDMKSFSWKSSPSNGGVYHMKVQDKIFVISKTPEGVRIEKTFEAP